MKEKLTGWYPREIEPVRVGVYEVLCDLYGPIYSHWNGYRWGMRCGSVKAADSLGHDRALGPVDKWRGLAKKPRATT